MAATNGYRHYSGVFGSKEIWVGKDESVYNFTDIASAVAAAQNGDIINITPGTYALTATLAINKPCYIRGHGDVFVTGGTAGIATALITINQPATYSGTVYNTLENLKISNAYANTACIDIDNDGGGAQVMNILFKDCAVSANGTGMAINIDQTSAYAMTFVSTSSKLDAITLVTVGLKIAASSATFIGHDIGVCALGTTNTAWIFQMIKCLYASAAQTSGGNASVITNFWDNVSKNSGAIAAQVLADFDATSASENATTNTLL